MNLVELREFCLSKPGVTEELPFDEDTLVFKVMGKMFALTSISEASTVNLKCDPEYASELRERYLSVKPGWHMSKTHWNTVALHGDVDRDLLISLIDHSYDLVVKGLPRKIRAQLQSGS